MSETIVVTAPSSGTPVQPAPPAPSRLDDVHAVIAQLEGAKPTPPAPAPDKGQEAAPEAPAPMAQQPAPAEPPKVEPPVEAKPAEAPAAPAKTPYTAEEFAAFDGNYNRRDFDWDRWPENLKESKEFARSVASGYGKRHAILEQQLREQLKQELSGQIQPPQPTATNTPSTTDIELTPEQMADAQELLVTPGKFFEGFRVLLGTKQGRDMLAAAGFTDPAERAVVSELADERIITRAIANIQEEFPAYVQDATYRGEVAKVFDENPMLLQKVKSRSETEATWAFAVANTIATTRRLSAREATIASERQKLSAREAAVIAKEQELQRQIEAANRQEPKSPAVESQSSGVSGLKPSRLDEAREAMRAAGMPA